MLMSHPALPAGDAPELGTGTVTVSDRVGDPSHPCGTLRIILSENAGLTELGVIVTCPRTTANSNEQLRSHAHTSVVLISYDDVVCLVEQGQEGWQVNNDSTDNEDT